MTPGAPGALAELEWRDGLPWSRRFEDRYFSRQGGLAESRHVFLAGNGLPERWQATAPSGPFTVLETGFGSGLNLLASCALWQASGAANDGRQLHYIAVEGYPMRAADQRRALAAAGAPAALCEALVSRMPAPTPGAHWVLWPERSLRLLLLIAELDAGLRMLANAQVDAWFLDGFSPRRNPQMWREALYRHMARLSAPAASFATYTAAGVVRRGLSRHGFETRAETGFGTKRDMLCGRLATGAARPARRPAARAAAIVVGAGLAGSHLAASLAARHREVCLLEAAETPTVGARQAAIYTRLQASDAPSARFALACLGYALGHYRALFDDGRLGDADGALCGMLALPADERQRRAQRRVAERFAGYPELLASVDAERASALAGTALVSGGLHFPGAGWLDPDALCRALRDHPRIRYQPGSAVRRLEWTARRWRALDADGRELASAPELALANSHGAVALLPAGLAPSLQLSRGQLSYLRADALSGALDALGAVVCRRGYAMPACMRDGVRVVSCGASYQRVDPGAADTGMRAAEHEDNWTALCGMLVPAQRARMPAAAVAGGYVGLRCHAADHLPVVGPCGPPGLYLNVAHGSRGVCQTPLCAEWLAARMTGDVLPVDSALDATVSPTRAALSAAA